MIHYKILEEKTNAKYISFGISVHDDNGNSVTLHDVFTTRSEAECCIMVFNREQLEIVHLEQVLEEYLQYFAL